MHRALLILFVSLLLTACDSHKEYFLSGSFTWIKSGCHNLSGMSRESISLCYPEQLSITDVMYTHSLGKRERYVELTGKDVKGLAVTVWVSEAQLQRIGKVTINLRTEKTMWGKFESTFPYLPYLLVITAVIWIRSAARADDVRAGRLCPKCNCKDIERHSSSYDYDDTETKTRTVKYFNKEGEETGYSEEEYEVPATFTHTTYSMKCKACNHKWTS